MNLEPYNKYLIVKLIEEPSSAAFGFKEKSKHQKCEITAVSSELGNDFDEGESIVVFSHMIDEFRLGEETFFFVPNTAIICIVTGS